MTGPVPPIVPRPPAAAPVSPVLRSEHVHRRDPREDAEDERRRERDDSPRDDETGQTPVVDADGHVDIRAEHPLKARPRRPIPRP